MPDKGENKTEANIDRIKLTARVSLEAYDAITELQRDHRRKTGRALLLWRIVDQAIKAYTRNTGNRD